MRLHTTSVLGVLDVFNQYQTLPGHGGIGTYLGGTMDGDVRRRGGRTHIANGGAPGNAAGGENGGGGGGASEWPGNVAGVGGDTVGATGSDGTAGTLGAGGGGGGSAVGGVSGGGGAGGSGALTVFWVK